MPRFSIIRAALARHRLAASVVILAGTAAAVAGSAATDELYESVARIPLESTEPERGMQPLMQARVEAAEARFRSRFPGAEAGVKTRLGNRTAEVYARGGDASDVRTLAGAVAGDLVAIERGLDQQALQAEAEALRGKLAGKLRPARRQRIARRLRTVRDLIVHDGDFAIAPEATRLTGPEPVRSGVLALLVAALVAASTTVLLDRLPRGRRSQPTDAGSGRKTTELCQSTSLRWWKRSIRRPASLTRPLKNPRS